MHFDFKDQTAIVTGGTRGIGRSVSEAFLDAGAKVIATYQSNRQAAEQFQSANKRREGRLDVRQFDIARYDEAEAFFKYVEETHGKFEILVNNSGVRRDAALAMMKESDWNLVIDTNLNGVFNMCKPAVRSLMRQRYGRIVTITSPIGRIGFPGQANYAASKAGQVALTRSLSKEVASRGITVNCVSPGFIDTEFIADLPEERKKLYLGQVPMKRFGKPEEVAQCVLFLASPQASYITGAVLEVTGGI
ncbi:MAG: beta-ketoacyl-ACP reductase [Nitrospinae bacterium]|nr:beta-ketoacyl-ACP reductase [Nitrospinota bacterium]